MAISATTIFEVQTGGSDTNGGGYSSGGTDYSQQTAAQLTVTDAACTGNTTLTSATGGFTSAMIGNIAYLSSGPNWYQITAQTDTNTVTIDRNGPNASGMTANVGGCLASPGGLGALLVAAGGITASQRAYVKSGTYNLTGTTVNVSGGPLDLSVTNLSNKKFYLKGYETTRTDLTGTRPIIKANANAPTQMIRMGGGNVGGQILQNFDVDGESLAVNGINGGATIYSTVCDCHVYDCDATYGVQLSHLIRTKISSCAAIGAYQCTSTGGWFDGNEYGVGTNNNPNYGYHSNSIASNNSVDGFVGGGLKLSNCIAYNNGSDGIDGSTTRPPVLDNCISFSDAGYGYRLVAGGLLMSCAYGGDGGGSGRTDTTPFVDDNPITLTADPFTNAAVGDFSLNNTAGGGALLRAAGISTYGQTGYLDVGAVQHADPAGGGGLLRRLAKVTGA